MRYSTNSVPVKNLGVFERWASICGGVALVSYGMKKRSMGGMLMAVIGGDFIYSGMTGYSRVFDALGIPPPDELRGRSASIPYRQGVRIDTSITIDKTREELYVFWRNLENLPRFMRRLRGVTVIDNIHSHWITEGPGRKQVEWDAEINNDQPNELIGWRSLPGSEVDTAGSVHFKPAPGGRGTEVYVELQYNPPGGVLGAAVAKLMGKDPADQIKQDLRRLKQILETGELATTEGQPTGKEALKRGEPAKARRAAPTSSDEVEIASEESFPASDAPSWTAPGTRFAS